MDRALRIFRAACLLGIGIGLAVALVGTIRDDAGAEPVVTTTTVPATPVRLADVAVGLSGPIGAGIEGTTAEGTVRTWRLPSLGLPELPSVATVVQLALATIAVACLIVVAAVRI